MEKKREKPMKKKEKSPRTLSALLTVAVLASLLACLPFSVGADGELTDGDFQYAVYDGEATVIGYLGDGGDVTIPSTLGGCPVTAIGDHAFPCRTKLTSVVLPEGVTGIGNGAFSSCTGLTVLPTTSTAPGENCTFLGLEGKYITQIQESIDRINEIRLEACNEGVINPTTGKPLTMDDYLPIQWSADLESIARIRAAEASVTMAHERTNGESIWFSGPNGVQNNAEVIAWNWSETMTSGIEQWYDEKFDWVNRTGGVTGHYTSLINPGNRFVGIGTFCSNRTAFYNTTVGEFSSRTSVPDTSRGSSTGMVIQTLEVRNERISYEIECPDTIIDSAPLSVSAVVTFQNDWSQPLKTGGLVLMEEDAKQIQWLSSDESVLSVTNGEAKAGLDGDAVLSAKLPNGSVITKAVAVRKTVLGDIDGEDGVTAFDYLLLKRAVLGTYWLSDGQAAAADIDGEDGITAFDYLLLKRAVLGTYRIG